MVPTLSRKQFACSSLPLLALLFVLSALTLTAQDWPQILGPQRDGIYRGPALSTDWTKSAPKVLWQKAVGAGFAGPAIAHGKLILFHRQDDNEVIECFDTSNGKSLWAYKYRSNYSDDFGFDDGPRAVPTIAGDRIVTLGANGMLTCVRLKDGTKLWQMDTRKQFHAGKGFFGLACAPLVEGDNVIVDIGGQDGAGIISVSLKSGELKWKTNNDEASYSSPTAATIKGKRYAFVFQREGLTVLDPATGKVWFDYPWRSRQNASVNAATPLIFGDRVFISASYDTGASLLDLSGDQPKVIWSNDDSMSNHYSTCVHDKGFLYGLHGRHDFPGGTELRCVELTTGKVKWTKAGLTPANLLLAGNQLLVLTERGELLSVAATPDGFKLNGRTQILGSGVRALPALANRVLYARDPRKLIALDLR